MGAISIVLMLLLHAVLVTAAPTTQALKNFQRTTRAMTATVALVCVLNGGAAGPCRAAEEENTLVSQLRAVAASQIDSQRARVETQEGELMTKELLYPDGKLIARGIVRLVPDAESAGALKAFKSSFPFGYPDAVSLDPAFADPQSTLFILGVGREGPPLAAKRIKIKDVDFPIVFEMSTDDLVFPYTSDAFLASPNSHDTIALTAILTPGNTLAVPSAAGRVGFGLTEPTQVAGAFSRTTAEVNVGTRLDGKLYTEEETGILSGIDRELDRISKPAGRR